MVLLILSGLFMWVWLWFRVGRVWDVLGVMSFFLCGVYVVVMVVRVWVR